MRGHHFLSGIFASIFGFKKQIKATPPLPAPAPTFPCSTRKPDGRPSRWVAPPLLALLLYAVVPAGLGIGLIWLERLVVDLWKIELPIPFAALVFTFYFLALSIFLFKGATWDAANDTARSIDHGVRRVLSIAVIGVSDLLCQGRTGAARFFYTVFVTLLGFLGLLAIYFVEQQPTFEKLVDYMSGKSAIGSVSYSTALLWGLMVSYVLLLVMLPAFALAVPSWRKMTARPTLRPHQDLRSADGGSILRVAHITDLHVLDKQNPHTVAALTDANRFNADVIALTGDLTDNGSIAAWNEFLMLPQLATGDERVVMVPGNHDLNTWNHKFWRSVPTVESYARTEAHRRAYFYLQVATRVMGKRTWLVCPFTGAIRRLAEVYAQAAPGLLAWDTLGNDTEQIKPSEFLASLFPMAVETHPNASVPRVTCLVWNTVKANRWALLNSIGDLDLSQVKRGEQLLQGPMFAERPVLHMMHHQLAVPRARIDSVNRDRPRGYRYHTIGMGLETAEHFLSLVRKRHQRTCLLHGHHHKYFLCKVEKADLLVVSGPSTKYGTEVSYSPLVPADDDIRWLGLKFVIDGTHLDLTEVVPMRS